MPKARSSSATRRSASRDRPSPGRRTTRRPGLPRENPLLFYPRRAWEILSTFAEMGKYYLWLQRLRKRIEAHPKAATYTDLALTRLEPAASPASKTEAA